ncbi:hypothetical protein DOK76_09165 [Vagococcus sp. DIV0080]|uniref:Uncharacterized protein n=1 Tax=Candidatus Vagococcus giribetii TaxID=2230876 RepID=A0ABS3HVL1_9ENTE|nr:hypothetical protein [Vagococcus sp. DIV0080]MBO0477242.1 hypothetical protein [Vagococcus sp. DIV0080]
MKDGKIQGTGFIIAVIFTFIMLTAGRVPTIEEQETAKQQAKIQKSEAESDLGYVNRMFVKSNSIVNSDGTELPKVKSKDINSTEIERFLLKNGQTLNFSFKLYDQNISSDDLTNNIMTTAPVEMVKKLDFENIRLEDNIDNMEFKNLRDFKLDEENMIISFNADLVEDQEYGIFSHETYLKVNLDYIDDSNTFNNHYVVNYAITSESREAGKNRTYEDDGTVKGRGDVSSNQQNKNTYKKETYVKGEDTTIPINDGNIEDWEHILDADQIEDGIAADGEGIYD